jgi:CRISPR-associated protein Cas2
MAAADKRWRLVAYDIRDPARWRKVYKIVCGAGERVQYSLFRCRLDNRDVERLRWRLARVMASEDSAAGESSNFFTARWRLARVMASEDSLLVVDLCPTCASNVIARNHVEGWETRPPTFRIIGSVTAADHEHADGDEMPEVEQQEDVSDRDVPGSLETE